MHVPNVSTPFAGVKPFAKVKQGLFGGVSPVVRPLLRWSNVSVAPEEILPGRVQSLEDFLASMAARRPIKGLEFKDDGSKCPEVDQGQKLAKARGMMGEAIKEFRRVNAARWEARAAGEDAGHPVMYVIKTDPSNGKTHAAIDNLVEIASNNERVYLRPKDGPKKEAGWAKLPVVFATPSHALGREFEERLERAAAAAGQDKPQVAYLEGKTRAGEAENLARAQDGRDDLVIQGCHFPEKMLALINAGLPSGNLCKARQRVTKMMDGKEVEVWETNFCPKFAECQAQQQRQALNVDPLRRGVYVEGKLDREQQAEAERAQFPDVVRTVHALADKKAMPHLVKNPLFAIVDEDLTKMMRNHVKFPASILRSPIRPMPRVTEKEAAEGVEPGHLLAEHQRLCDIAHRALTLASVTPGLCPVEKMADLLAEQLFGGRPSDPYQAREWDLAHRGEAIVQLAELVKLAKRVAWGASTSNMAYGPSSTLAQVQKAAEAPKQPHAAAEWRFWWVVADRLELLMSGGTPAREETRISIRDGVVRVAWRSNFIWADTETDVLLLDGSAKRELVEALFPSHEVVFVDCSLSNPEINGALPIKVVAVPGLSLSNSSLVPGPHASADAQRKAANNIASMKKALDTIVSFHAGEEVLVCSTAKVERTVLKDWAVCANTAASLHAFQQPDSGLRQMDAGAHLAHFGNVRGQDGYKKFSAVVAPGKQEPPWESVELDSLCCTYDKPRQADDLLPARSPREENSPMTVIKRKLRRRTGGYATFPTWVPREKFARLLYEASREEEIVQAVGRVRPALRFSADQADWPVAWVMGNVFPDSFIYDDFVHIFDLGRGADVISAAISNDGCIWAEAAVDLGLANSGRPDDVVAKQKSGSDWLKRAGFGRALPTAKGWAKVAVAKEGGGQPVCVHVWLASLPAGQSPEAAAAKAVGRRSRDAITSVTMVEDNPIQFRVPTKPVNERAEWVSRVEAVADAMQVACSVKPTEDNPVILFDVEVELVLLAKSYADNPEMSWSDAAPPDPDALE